MVTGRVGAGGDEGRQSPGRVKQVTLIQHEFNACWHHGGMLTRIPTRADGHRRRFATVPRLLILALLLAAGAASAHAQKSKAPKQPLTLEQAVAKVQKQTGGKVLAADTQRRGHTIEYRIKVLTPKGHVRVVPVRTEAPRDGNDKEKR
jgi:hypothetical protein